MSDAVTAIVQKHRQAGILVDSNLLLLYLVGGFDRTAIAGFKRLQAYEVADYDLLCRLLSYFDRIIVTPNILTEVSNLAGHLRQDVREAFFMWLAVRLATSEVAERYIESNRASARTDFRRLGLTDMAIGVVAASNVPVLTDDVNLYLHLTAHKADVLNFNHIRFSSWLQPEGH